MLIKRVFKIVNQKIKRRGKLRTKAVCKEGVNGTGVTLPYACGFCRDKDGTTNAAFRTRTERNRHASFCVA